MTNSELEGFVYRFEPGDSDRTLLLLHGTGGNEDDLVPLGSALDPTANLLSPRGQVLENGFPRFFRRFAEGKLDIDDLKERTHGLVRFVEAAAEQHDFDPARAVAVGYSNGANIAVSTMLLYPSLLSAAVLMRPMYVYEPDPMPTFDGVSVFIASGGTDPLIDPNDAERLARLLETAGADVTHEWSPGGHPLEMNEVQRATSWLADLP